MPSRIRKRGLYWHYDNNRQPPHRFRLALHTSSKANAKRLQILLDREYLKNPLEEKFQATQISILRYTGQFIEYLYSVKSPPWALRLHQALRHIIDFAGDQTLDEITPADIDAYIMQRLKNGASTKTVRMELQAVQKLFARAVRDGHIKSNPVDGIDPPAWAQKRTIRPFTPQEITRILQDQQNCSLARKRDRDAAHDRFPVFATLYYTGLRISDVITMQVDEFDLAGCLYDKQTIKTGKHIRMPLAAPLVAILADTLPKGGPAFPRFYSASELERKIKQRTLLICLQRTLKRLDIPHASLHSFRHTFNQRLFELGLSLEDRQTLLGHSAGRTTKVYTHPNEQLAKEYLDKL